MLSLFFLYPTYFFLLFSSALLPFFFLCYLPILRADAADSQRLWTGFILSRGQWNSPYVTNVFITYETCINIHIKRGNEYALPVSSLATIRWVLMIRWTSSCNSNRIVWIHAYKCRLTCRKRSVEINKKSLELSTQGYQPSGSFPDCPDFIFRKRNKMNTHSWLGKVRKL
jgi:hypothetical protein